jgi:hypothetical protein
VAELTQMVETLAMKDLQKVNRRAISLKQRDRSGKPKNLRINFGVYFYSEPGDDDSGTETASTSGTARKQRKK